ncbi:MAG: amylo-alpha-1,6-glucosidase, partial [Verrucomicrobiota bacterium]
PLHAENLLSIQSGPPAIWNFAAKVGNERMVKIQLSADMLEGKNTTVFRFELKQTPVGKRAPSKPTFRSLHLAVRVDIEDRSFHSETHRCPEAENYFNANTKPLSDKRGFAFTPAADRHLRVYSDGGAYHHEAEWSENIPHPIEQTRGHVGAGDAFSPGWFELPLAKDKTVSLVLCADAEDPLPERVEEFSADRLVENKLALDHANFPEADSFGRQLALAAKQFVVRRGAEKTVIAGYPWFLDWGRDSLIAARGLLAAGLVEDVTELLVTFGRFVENGTMPNTIHGQDATNRDTSDAPLWFGVVCDEVAKVGQASRLPILHENNAANSGTRSNTGKAGETPALLYSLAVHTGGKTLGDVLREIAVGYIRGTPNGIRMDAASGLIWSPSHFTWMDTNHPAGTPREGYPIEIQVLWIRLLRQLDRLKIKPETESWIDLSKRAEASLQKYFWLEEHGWFSDLLIAKANRPAAEAVVDDSLRGNFLFAIAFGFVSGEKARRGVDAALRYLVVPGGLRTVAPLHVKVPLPIYAHGNIINDPLYPYWPRYEGDEDTRRKPAYHNGTAWTWTFPIFCEALARAWDFSPEAVAAAKAYLGSMEKLLVNGCLGQIPEI